MQVAGGEHVGIVGRTGSGKSSLFLVFFRIVEPEAGKVIVDGVNIGNLGLTTLRKSLSMIPQVRLNTFSNNYVFSLQSIIL